MTEIGERVNADTNNPIEWPISWRTVPLWSLYERIKDVGHPNEDMLSVYRKHGVVKKDGRDDNFNKTAENRDIYQLVDDGWLIVNRMKAWQGSVGVSPYRGIVSGHYICFRPNHDEDPRFLNWLLRSAVYSYEYARRSRGVRPNQIEIDNDELRTLPIRLPGLDEQRRIADFLDTEADRVDGVVARRATYIQHVHERLDSLWSTTIADAAPNSSWIPLRRFVEEITDGPFGSSLNSDHYTDEGVRVIRLGNIGRARFRPNDAAYISEEHFLQLRRHEAKEGDLLIAGLGDESQPLGRACVLPNGVAPAMVKADCFRLRLDRRVDHNYAAWTLSSPLLSQEILLLARGSTRSRINLNIAREIRIPVPPLAEQRDIVSKLDRARAETDQIVNACSKQITLLNERRQALITAAVCGQFDVSTGRGAGLP
jgi:type I restriction enzyme S subunit